MEILKKLDWVTSPVGTTMKMESYDVRRVEKSSEELRRVQKR